MNAGFQYRATVGPGDAGAALVDHLATRYTHSSRDEWRARVAMGLVTVDGCVVAPGTILRRGQAVVWSRPPWREPDAPLAWALLYRDDDVLAAAKPAGLPTVPGGGRLENTLLALVRRRFAGAAPVHRLDRGASGIVLFALSPRARVGLARAFRDGLVVKRYRALVLGAPERDAFVVDARISKVAHPRLGLAYAASARIDDGSSRTAAPAAEADGTPSSGSGLETSSRPAEAPGTSSRPSRTEVEVLERRGASTLVAVRPISGRPHQIRIHLAVAGLPLAGDPLYGPGGAPRAEAAAAGECGYHLHAESIGFAHPSDGRLVHLACAPPPALRMQSAADEGGGGRPRP